MKKLTIDLLFSRDSLYNQRKYSPLHYHKENELYFLLKGKTKYFVDNETFILNEGDLIIIPKYSLHSTDSETCLYNERLLISFNDNLYSQSVATCLQELFDDKIIHIPKENLTLIENMFYKIESEYQSNRINRDALIKLYISELICYLHRYRSSTSSDKQNTDELIQQIAQYINLNFENEITLSGLSHIFGISKSYLSRRFKLSTGTCINEYINYVRISHAEQMLKNQKIPITEVAMRCGFNDSSYFASIFKKLKGITPYKFSVQENNSKKPQYNR